MSFSVFTNNISRRANYRDLIFALVGRGRFPKDNTFRQKIKENCMDLFLTILRVI